MANPSGPAEQNFFQFHMIFLENIIDMSGENRVQFVSRQQMHILAVEMLYYLMFGHFSFGKILRNKHIDA